jgi:hypothetical protein
MKSTPYLHFLLLLLGFLLVLESCTTKTQTDCPFRPLTTTSVHKRDATSVKFSASVKAALSKFSLELPVDAEAASKIGAELSSLTEEYQQKPIDPFLAGNYNYQVEVICGLYRYVNELDEGSEKQQQQKLLAKSIIKLLVFADDYKSGRSPVPLDLSVEQACEYASEFEQQTISLIDNKIAKCKEPRKKEIWEMYKEGVPSFIEDCRTQPNCKECLDNILNKVRSTTNPSLIKF